MGRATWINLAKLTAAVAVCEGVGALGALVTMPAISTWYAALAKPPFTPPDWVFGPVWTLLYALMGVSAFLVWRIGLQDRRVRVALAVFLVQLLLNGLWSPLFFGLRSPLAGLFDIIALWLAIVATYAVFRPLSRPAALLLLPYLLWVSYAAVINASLVILNP